MEEGYPLDDSMDLDLVAAAETTEAEAAQARNNMILRTRSLDEPSRHYPTSCAPHQQEERTYQQAHDEPFDPTEIDALHSSFDASLLNIEREGQPEHGQSLRVAASWDENEPSGLLAEKKHSRPHFSIDIPDLPPPGTVRKSTRRSNVESTAAGLSKTPLRPRFRPTGTAVKKTTGKLTPASAKRRRAPLQRRSPMRRVPPKTPRESSLTRSSSGLTPRRSTQLHHHDMLAPATSGFGLFAPTNGESFDPYGTTPCFSNKKPSKISFGTVATVASSTLLETTTETADSVDDSLESSTPFRFTSFPASLPRINNNGQPQQQQQQQPGDRQQPPGTVRKRMFGDPLNTSRDDDGTHNSSISSLHDEIGNNNHHAVYSEDEQDSTPSPMGTPVARTRLNFNTVLSPLETQLYHQGGHQAQGAMQIDADQEVDLSCPYEATRMSSFASTLSSHTQKNGLGFDDVYTSTAPTTGLTPSRGGQAESRFESHRPGTPKEVQLHLQLDAAQCSPIPGIPEEDGDVSSKSTVLSGNPLFAHRGSESVSSSVGSKKRRPLPMPDMHAFDGEAMSSSRDRSIDESATTGSRSHPPSPKLLCPPTPVRTPAWAHTDVAGNSIFKATAGHNKFHRANSLIATKVLLKSSPQVLDGRTSLENSVLEEDGSKTGARPQASSIASTLDADDSDVETIVEAEESAMDEDISWLHDAKTSALPRSLPQPNLEPRRSTGEIVSMATTFETLSLLGSGTFADVYKVRSKTNGSLYAIKRNRRQFRGKRDREKALTEVRHMQRLQSVCVTAPDSTEYHEKSSYSLYLLFFYQAWQEEGHFFCQTELCCRDTCRELMDSLHPQWNLAKTRYPSILQLPPPAGTVAGSEADVVGRLLPEATLWKICHDLAAGLSHIHSHGIVHYDIKPSNMFFIAHSRFGAMCKIGDFGMAGDIGSSEDGQEGDQKYMAPELLSSGVKHPSADIFSLGLTLYELASDLSFEIPSDGPHWHELRSGQHQPMIPLSRNNDLTQLIQRLLIPASDQRPTADMILTNSKVKAAGHECDVFLSDYLGDIDAFDLREIERAGMHNREEQTPHGPSRVRVCSPSMGALPTIAPLMYSPEATR